MNTKKFENLTKSEIKKAIRYFEKKHPGAAVIASGWASHPQTDVDALTEFLTVSVELWSEEERESYTVYVAVCLWDRRKSFVMKDAENWYRESAQEATEDATEAQEETTINTNINEKENDTMTTNNNTITETAPAFTITKNDQFNSVEVSFSGKPSAKVRDALKALRFRWHGVKRVWYGYATEEAVRAAIEGQSGEMTANSTEGAPKASKATKATQKVQGTAQNHIRIYWNGIKIDGGKLIRCGYSIDNNAENTPSVSIYARDYDNLPRDLFEVRNNSDSYTDYFENDSAYLTPAHPLYKYFRFAAMKAKARDDSKYCEYLRETLNSGKREPWAGHYDNLRADLARREQFLAEFDQMTDPGQPTAEDLEQIDRQRQEAENAQKAAEHEEELRKREARLCQRVNGQRLIRAE